MRVSKIRPSNCVAPEPHRASHLALWFSWPLTPSILAPPFSPPTRFHQCPCYFPWPSASIADSLPALDRMRDFSDAKSCRQFEEARSLHPSRSFSSRPPLRTRVPPRFVSLLDFFGEAIFGLEEGPLGAFRVPRLQAPVPQLPPCPSPRRSPFLLGVFASCVPRSRKVSPIIPPLLM